MIKLKSRNLEYLRNLILSLILLALSIYVITQKSFQLKYLIAVIIAIGMIIVNFLKVKEKKNTISEVDERDVYNIMKSCKQSLRIINVILFVLIEILLVLYTFTKTYLYLTISITLTSVIILMFLIILICNIYYEKHN